jgi:hypothetical protein
LGGQELLSALCSLLSALRSLCLLLSALCFLLSALSALCSILLGVRIKSLTWKLFFGGQWLLSALWSLLFAAGRPGRRGSSFSQLKALLGNCFLEANSCSLLSAHCSPLSALCWWEAWGLGRLGSPFSKFKSLTWKLFLGGQELLSAFCFLLSAVSALCSVLLGMAKEAWELILLIEKACLEVVFFVSAVYSREAFFDPTTGTFPWEHSARPTI